MAEDEECNWIPRREYRGGDWPDWEETCKIHRLSSDDETDCVGYRCRYCLYPTGRYKEYVECPGDMHILVSLARKVVANEHR